MKATVSIYVSLVWPERKCMGVILGLIVWRQQVEFYLENEELSSLFEQGSNTVTNLFYSIILAVT